MQINHLWERLLTSTDAIQKMGQ